jgi:hypothetical protein
MDVAHGRLPCFLGPRRSCGHPDIRISLALILCALSIGRQHAEEGGWMELTR